MYTYAYTTEIARTHSTVFSSQNIRVAMSCNLYPYLCGAMRCRVWQSVAACCSVLRCVAVRCSLLHCLAVRTNGL